MKANVRYGVLGAGFFLFCLLGFAGHRGWIGSEESNPKLRFEDVLPRVKAQKGLQKCTMSTCFDFERCVGRPKKVFVYPDLEGTVYSHVYADILKVIREGPFYTENPDEACLFVLSIDTIDRDVISENFVRNVNDRIASLPTRIWNNGRNHVIFNLYHGTFPSYTEDLGFEFGEAMVARASASTHSHRAGFDLSFPLFHAEHPLRTATPRPIVGDANADKWLFSFKGKRYVYGIGSETRDNLHHLHNNASGIIATTCRHNSDWKKFEDSRCAVDNAGYDEHDYETLLTGSTFCLTPRGRRLGSFRFLESLRAGCIPVVLSDGWQLPFGEIVDWSTVAVVVHERNALHLNNILRRVSPDALMRMKAATRFVYHRHFSSVEKIVQTTFDVLTRRLAFLEGQNVPRPCVFPDRLSAKAVSERSFTLVLHGILKYSSRLNRLVSSIANVAELSKIIVLWPKPRGQPPEVEAFRVPTPLQIIEVDSVADVNVFNLAPGDLAGEWVVSMDERSQATPNQVRALLRVAAAQQTPRIVSSSLLVHGDVIGLGISATGAYSMATMHFSVVPRILLDSYESWLVPDLRELVGANAHCHTLLFNAFMADTTLQPSLAVGERSLVAGEHVLSRNTTLCWQKNAFQKHWHTLPFLTGNTRIHMAVAE